MLSDDLLGWMASQEEPQPGGSPGEVPGVQLWNPELSPRATPTDSIGPGRAGRRHLLRQLETIYKVTNASCLQDFSEPLV